MARTVAFTSFTYAYLPRAILLARTLRAAHPDWELHALVVDLPTPGAGTPNLLETFDAVMFADLLGFAHFPTWMFKHDVVEACTAVKGRMLRHLLDAGAEKVFYFDPDMAVFHPLDEIAGRLGGSSILLTPHQLKANVTASAAADNELASLRYGSYNLGFIAVANDPNGRAFAAWWDEQLTRACYDEPDTGIFTDQKYCDLVPALFDGVAILRDPGCNVASWNISCRQLAVTPEGDILANGSRLKFYHFTKIFGVGMVMTDKYATDNLVVIELRNWYRAAVGEIATAIVPQDDWAYDRFDNGEPIPKSARVKFRNRDDLMRDFPNPFAAAGNSYYTWLKREMPDLLGPDVP